MLLCMYLYDRQPTSKYIENKKKNISTPLGVVISPHKHISFHWYIDKIHINVILYYIQYTYIISCS